MSDGGIRGKPGETVRATAFESDTKIRQARGAAGELVCFREADERLANGAREHRRLGRAFLLLEKEERLAELRIALLDGVLNHRNLRVLAAEAQDRGSGDVGMDDVIGEQCAKVLRVFASRAAAAFVKEELDAVDVFEKLGRGRRERGFSGREFLQF